MGSWGHVARAQSGHFSASSLSMGGTGVAHLDSYHANFRNPANLMLNRGVKPPVSVGLLGGISATAGGPLLNISLYNKHFTTGEVVNSQRVLNEWFGSDPARSYKVGLEMDVIPVGGSWRGENKSASLALRNRTLFSTSMNRGYANLLLSGISEKRFSDPTPVNFSSEMVMFSEVSAGYAMKVAELSSLFGFAENVRIYAGAAPKYIVPHYTSGFDFNSTLQVTGNKVVHDFQYSLQTVGSLARQFREYHEASQAENFQGSLTDFIKPGAADLTDVRGAGWGIDFGGTIEMDLVGSAASAFSWIEGSKRLRVALSMSDIGSITYNKKVGTFSADKTFTWDGVDFKDGFTSTLADSISQEIYLNYQPTDKKSITKYLPAKVHLGSHLQLGKLAVALDFTKGLNDAGMNSKWLALGFGAEYNLFNFLPVRAGFRAGGLTSTSITFGTGLEFRNFEFSVGALTVPNSRSHGAGIGGAWSGLLFRF